MLKSKVEGKIKALKKLPMKTKIVIAVGLAGILLIFVSEMFPAKNTAESKSIPTESVATDDTDSYKKQIEKELKDVLSQVRGVGECEVMVTVEGTTEYVYAENLTKSTDNNGDRTSDRYENEIVITDNDGKKEAKAIECKVKGVEKGIVLTENDLVFVTNGSCTEGTIYGDQNHAPNGDAEVRTSGVWSLWKNIAKQDPSFGHPEKFCSDVSKTNWESATVTTLDDKIIPYITNICKRDPRSGKVVTGGIVSCQDSKWLMSWTINRQGQFKEQDKNQVCVWVYGLFTDVPGDYIKKPMKDCTGKEITEEWLYHLGVPVEDIEDLAEHSAVCVPTMMPYITAFFMPRTKGDRPDVIPDGCVNFAFLGQFAETPRDTVFTTEYSVRTAMEAVYGLLGVDRGVPEVWGSVYDVRELLDSSVKLMDGMSPLEIELPGPLNALKKPLLRVVKGTVVEKLLRDHNVIKDGMLD